jgi:hypothetical protein
MVSPRLVSWFLIQRVSNPNGCGSSMILIPQLVPYMTMICQLIMVTGYLKEDRVYVVM